MSILLTIFINSDAEKANNVSSLISCSLQRSPPNYTDYPFTSEILLRTFFDREPSYLLLRC